MTAIILPPMGGGVTIYPDPSALPAIAEVGEIVAVASDVTVRQWDGAAWAIRGSASTPASVSDTNSVDLTVTLGVLTADLRLSATLAGAGFQDVTLVTLADGLAAAIADTEIRSVLSVLDTSSIDSAYNATTGVFSATLKLSASGAGAGFQDVALDLQADGLRAQVADSEIRSPFSAVSPLSYNSTTGAFSIANQTSNLVLAGPVSGVAAAPTFRGLVVADIPTGIAHGSLSGLLADDHTQYALLAGRGSGQLLIGGIDAVGNLELQSTSNATRGLVIAVDTFLAQSALRKAANTTNASMVSGVAAQAAFPAVTNLQAATVTLESLSSSFAFVVSLSTGESIEFHASQARAEISAISDPSGLFLLTDAGTGLFVSKSTSSSVISIKNRMGGTRNIGVSFLSGHVSTATAWA